MLNTMNRYAALHVRHNYLSFGDAPTLVTEGSRINMRLRDMLHDTVIVDANSAERAFRSVYRDVYDYLRATMFTKDGVVIWTFASQLERGGFSVSRAENGLNLTVGRYTLNIPSPTEPNYMTNAEVAFLAAIIHLGDNQ